MAISSVMLALNTEAPSFSLTDAVSGRVMSLDELASDTATVVMFICNHCPYVKHVNAGMASIANDYTPRGISFVAISANDPSQYAEDAPENMKKVAEKEGWSFPYLFDESQETARAYSAACTPEFYVFDGDRKLVYRGQFDDSRPNDGKPVTGSDVRAALAAILSGKPVSDNQIASIGCGIKWKR
ncbi:MAG: thioredoxin family protein [bacterium]|nr:thioredoxin family protein [Candidatus Kapabacteria bacterium]